MNETKRYKIAGDILEITWNGSVWVASCNGSQHARASEAMREEIVAYLSACGEHVAADAKFSDLPGEWID